jgi:hypothetical protein
VQGGVVAALPPDLVLLRDTDGDGKADERKVLVHGFGTGDGRGHRQSAGPSPGGRVDP